MKTVNVSELEAAALDWAVAKAAHKVEYNTDGEFGQSTGWLVRLGGHPCVMTGQPVWVWYKLAAFRPSTDWSQGGPLIEGEGYALPFKSPFHRKHLGKYQACTPGGLPWNGQTPLIAACRAIVAAKLGDTVEVPEELLS